jgi:hypothetical protein
LLRLSLDVNNNGVEFFSAVAENRELTNRETDDILTEEEASFIQSEDSDQQLNDSSSSVLSEENTTLITQTADEKANALGHILYDVDNSQMKMVRKCIVLRSGRELSGRDDAESVAGSSRNALYGNEETKRSKRACIRTRT